MSNRTSGTVTSPHELTQPEVPGSWSWVGVVHMPDEQTYANPTPCFSGNSIRAPMGNSYEVNSSVESSIQRSSHQQVSRRGQEACIFQGGPSSDNHCQFGRRRSGEVIFCSRLSNVPSNRLFFHRPTHRRLHAVHRACEEAGPDCGSGHEESGGGAQLPTRRARRCRGTSGRPPARSCKGKVAPSTIPPAHRTTADSQPTGDLPTEWASEIQRLRTEVARFKARLNQPVRDSVQAAQIVRAAAEKRRRHAHRRTASEVLVGGQESGDARCSGCGRYRGNILLGPLIAKGADHMRSMSRYENADEEFRSRSCIQEDSLPGSRRRVRRRIRDSDSEDALVRDGPGVPRQQFGRFTALQNQPSHHADGWCWSHPTQVDPVPPTVPSVDTLTVEEGPIYHDLTLIDSSDDDAPFVIPGSAVSPARPSRRVVLVPGSVDATPQSIQDRQGVSATEVALREVHESDTESAMTVPEGGFDDDLAEEDGVGSEGEPQALSMRFHSVFLVSQR